MKKIEQLLSIILSVMDENFLDFNFFFIALTLILSSLRRRIDIYIFEQLKDNVCKNTCKVDEHLMVFIFRILRIKNNLKI